MANTRTLRIATAATFLPAFPLCIAHGVVSQTPAPAVGLVPLAVSASVGVFLMSRQSAKDKRAAREPEPAGGGEGQEQQQEGGRQDAQQSQQPNDESTFTLDHPILVFAVDTILSAALLAVLVLTWISSSSRSTNGAVKATLAAYATMPLLANFFIHLYLAVRELSRGLAIPGLTQYLAWQAVPPDCPDCGRRLRPEAPPRMPWLDEASLPPRPSAFQNVKLRMPAPPKVKIPDWLRAHRARNGGYSGVPAADENEDEHVAAAPYRDDPEAAGEPSSSSLVAEPETVEPEVVDVVGKKSRKVGKNSGSSS
ncbi:hypothetical protein GGR52DRAFT_284928 [Hypoxylon sp. FL1284]|nr:hypothetical protein GGR52DRAFT_284928 [Hypoxylon sp. FL1284]